MERICCVYFLQTHLELIVYVDICFRNMNVKPLLLYLSRWTVWATSYRRSMGLRTKTTKKPRFQCKYHLLHESRCCKGWLKLYLFEFWLDLFSLSSHQMMRTVTTATSVLSVCLTCEIHSSCPADICVSATPAQTLCVTRPTTVQSAGCVRTAILINFCSLRCFTNAILRRVRV